MAKDPSASDLANNPRSAPPSLGRRPGTRDFLLFNTPGGADANNILAIYGGQPARGVPQHTTHCGGPIFLNGRQVVEIARTPLR